ncbi:glycosyltransferase family 4 protein [Nitrosomonas sp. Nm166]|uniref:glycosyltransferase family 4 protein n=1 Tax=Nitrosomonas sp. Nm166 TaxID=1881054 RepID=UPI0008E20354|nr:glycosyltransferase family 4 protein [Nitrosomonas sp. Nm166]SFD91646.1 Glycosyltransferase involved in cell wall bisynthesis [Nitrosomonas sp. Nm166]
MKVLLAHNYYGSSAPSGENQVFEAEGNLLRQRGHEVSEFLRHSDTIRAKGAWGAVQGACSTPWNPFAAKMIRQTVETCRPEVVHVHNTFPLLSPAIFHAIGQRAARVLTLHNYRLFCPAAIPMRNGKVCTDCMDRHSVLPALRHGCYRGSRLATLPLAANVTLHRYLGIWTKQVDAFIALTDFQREKMIEAGLPADRVHVKPNFYPGNPIVVPWANRRQSVVFAGRLTAEKGVLVLVQAWLMWGAAAPELRIVGNGELRAELEQLAATVPEVPIRFLGQLTGDAAQKEIARARLLVLPSECFEGFPMVIREAFAFGTPTAVSSIGPLPSIVRQGENGVTFAPGNPQSLLSVVRTTWEKAGELDQLAVGARRSYETLYNEEVNYRMLMTIYQQAMEALSSRKGSIQV